MTPRTLLLPALVLFALPGRAAPASPRMPTSIPGRVEAEDYTDSFDTTPGNTGGQYATEDVDIQATSDAGGGYNVGWIASGEWLSYSVNVVRPGTYSALARVASHFPGTRKFHLEVDGVNESGTVAFDLSAGWQVYAGVLAKGLELSTGARDAAYRVLTQPNANYKQSLLASRNVSGTVTARALYYAERIVAVGLWSPASASFNNLPPIAGSYHVRRGKDAAGDWYLCTVDEFVLPSAGDYTHFGVLVRHGGVDMWWIELNAGTQPQTPAPWGSVPAGTNEHWIGDLAGWVKLQ